MEIDLTLIGDKELMRKLNRLIDRAPKRVVNTAMRASAKRLRPKIAAATPVRGEAGAWFTGRQEKAGGTLKRAMANAKILVLRRRNQIGVAIHMPTRAVLGIPADAKGYYPVSIEYGFMHWASGQDIPARSYIRNTVDSNAASEHAQIGRDIGKGIEREAKKA